MSAAQLPPAEPPADEFLELAEKRVQAVEQVRRAYSVVVMLADQLAHLEPGEELHRAALVLELQVAERRVELWDAVLEECGRRYAALTSSR